jgi:hypothetical protein
MLAEKEFSDDLSEEYSPDHAKIQVHVGRNIRLASSKEHSGTILFGPPALYYCSVIIACIVPR